MYLKALRSTVFSVGTALVAACFALALLSNLAQPHTWTPYVLAVLATVLAGGLAMGYRLQLDQLQRDAERAADQYQRDLIAEQAAQENDIVKADNDAYLAALIAGNTNYQRDPRAVEIRARQQAALEEFLAGERTARQERIAAHEASVL